MAKICDRNYKGNGAYTVKTINGALCCPLCEKPTLLHGEPIEVRALAWALSDDTGTSSKTIARWMTSTHGITGAYFSPPSDGADRARCIRLLELIPEWLPRLNEMGKFYDSIERQGQSFTISSSGISADDNTWARQIPLIAKEGKFYAADNTTANN